MEVITARESDSVGSVSGAAMSNRQIEDAAIRAVLQREQIAGRRAVDVRGRGAVGDIEGDRIIEVKAYGTTARGNDMWLETRQVQAALADPERFHLVLVENVRQGDPEFFRVIDICGEDLTALLERRREKHYFEVPLPTGVYDRLVARGVVE